MLRHHSEATDTMVQRVLNFVCACWRGVPATGNTPDLMCAAGRGDRMGHWFIGSDRAAPVRPGVPYYPQRWSLRLSLRPVAVRRSRLSRLVSSLAVLSRHWDRWRFVIILWRLVQIHRAVPCADSTCWAPIERVVCNVNANWVPIHLIARCDEGVVRC